MENPNFTQNSVKTGLSLLGGGQKSGEELGELKLSRTKQHTAKISPLFSKEVFTKHEHASFILQWFTK